MLVTWFASLAFNKIKIAVVLAVLAGIAFVGWDYANAKSQLASRKAEVSQLKSSLKAIDTTHKLNLEALRRLDKSCADEVQRHLNLRDIDKIIKESATPIDDALKFDPNAKR